MRARGGRVVLLMVAFCCIGISHGRLSPLPRSGQEPGYLPDPTTAKLYSVGFDALLADFYWLQAVQIAGGRQGPTGQSQRIGALVDLVTQLNPLVDHPYRFAALWMTDDLDAIRQANELLERSIETHPDEWRNRFYLAFNLFFYLGENEQAADVLAGAVSLPRAPTYLGRLAARLRSDRDGLDASAAFLATLLDATSDPYAHAMYEQALDEIEAERRARVLDRGREAFKQRHGRDIASVGELLSGSPPILRALPPDPYGKGWELDAQGVIVSTGLGHRYEPQIDLVNQRRVKEIRSRTREAPVP